MSVPSNFHAKLQLERALLPVLIVHVGTVRIDMTQANDHVA